MHREPIPTGDLAGLNGCVVVAADAVALALVAFSLAVLVWTVVQRVRRTPPTPFRGFVQLPAIGVLTLAGLAYGSWLGVAVYLAAVLLGGDALRNLGVLRRRTS